MQKNIFTSEEFLRKRKINMNGKTKYLGSQRRKLEADKRFNKTEKRII